jgi:hypothetical protein
VSRFAVFGTKGWIDVRDKAHVEAPAGWIITRASVGSLIEISEVGPAEPVRENLVAFARAVRDGRPYEISGEDLVNNIALLEAIIRSAASGEVVAVGRRTVGQRRTLVAVLGRARHINSEEIVEQCRYMHLTARCLTNAPLPKSPTLRRRFDYG